jgi:ribosomal protein S27E
VTVDEELGMWTADAIRGSDWQALLDIPESAARATRIVDNGLEPYRNDSNASITACPRCQRMTMLRPHPAIGASCAYCRHVAIIPEDD